MDRQQRMEEVSSREHFHCFACGDSGQGLDLKFQALENGGVEAVFNCSSAYQGYDGIIQGGIVVCLMDAAMANCLFSYNHRVLTGKLKVRFKRPLLIRRKAVVGAEIKKKRPPLFVVKAWIIQDDVVKAQAEGEFLEK